MVAAACRANTVAPDRRLASLAAGSERTRVRPRLRAGLTVGFDRTLVDTFRLIRDDQVEVEINSVAKSLAPGARTVRIVKREQPRLGLFVTQVAMFALEAL